MTSRLFKSGTPHLSTGSHRALKTASTLNFSTELSSSAAWSPDHIATLGLPGEIAAQAFDPVQSLLCVATKAGSLHLFGAGPVKLEWAIKPSYAIKLLAFKSGTAFLFVIGAFRVFLRAFSAETLHLQQISRIL